MCRIFAPLVLIIMFTSAAFAAEGAPPQAGRQHLVFDQRSPLSSLEEFAMRSGNEIKSFDRERPGIEYDLSGESFEAYIPRACRKANPHGLLVWISPGEATLPEPWIPMLDRHKLVWICPNNAGNNRNPIVRIGLALDAVHNISQRYPIDEKRVYVSGFSGGGRAASIAAVGYPDVFAGGMFLMGCNFYRRLPAGEGKFYPSGAFRPRDELFDLARQHPLVLITAQRDMNRNQTRANLAAYKEDGFKSVTLLDLSGIGHEIPPVASIEKGVRALDAPRAASRPATVPARK